MRKIKNGKTVKQIADEIGVSKQAIHQKRKSKMLAAALQPFTTTVDGVVYISVDGENILKQAFTNNDRKQFDDNKSSTVYTPVDDTLYTVLKATIDTLQQQLQIKDSQIEKLTDALQAEQALHAESKGMLQAASTKLIEDGSKKENIGKFRKKLIEMLGG